jgi:CRP-like cAMP-binding protein
MRQSLEGIDVLRECTGKEIQAITEICRPMTVQQGDRIFEAGGPADFLYFVAEGVVELSYKVTHYLATKEITIDRIRKDQTFGWSALAESKTYTLSAVATTQVELFQVPATDLRKLCSEHHHLGYVLMKNIAVIIGGRFERTQRILMGVIQKQLDEKESRM